MALLTRVGRGAAGQGRQRQRKVETNGSLSAQKDSSDSDGNLERDQWKEISHWSRKINLQKTSYAETIR